MIILHYYFRKNNFLLHKYLTFLKKSISLQGKKSFKMSKQITTKTIEERVIVLRGQEVLIDRDVAELYGVETKRVNEAVKNNPEKFPEGYYFTLQPSEKQYVVENFDRMQPLKKSTMEPRAFTEKGLYMLATILKSPIATQTTIMIIETFAKLHELARNIQSIQNEPDKEKQKGLLSRMGELIEDLLIVDSDVTGSESTIELNLMAVKIKHTVKRRKKK